MPQSQRRSYGLARRRRRPLPLPRPTSECCVASRPRPLTRHRACALRRASATTPTSDQTQLMTTTIDRPVPGAEETQLESTPAGPTSGSELTTTPLLPDGYQVPASRWTRPSTRMRELLRTEPYLFGPGVYDAMG